VKGNQILEDVYKCLIRAPNNIKFKNRGWEKYGGYRPQERIVGTPEKILLDGFKIPTSTTKGVFTFVLNLGSRRSKISL
jgi:hypothetical protein